MKYEVKELETIKYEKETFEKLEIQPDVWYAYKYCKGTSNELPNFDDVIWEKDIKNIVDCMRRLGIKEFTISSTFSGLIKTIAKFEKEGCKLDGIIEIESRYDTELITDENGVTKEVKSMIPAFKLSIKGE